MQKPLNEKDIEAGKQATTYQNSDPEFQNDAIEGEVKVYRAREIQDSVAPLRWLGNGERWLDKKLGIETQGIDRIPEDEKIPPSIWNVFFIWFSVTCHAGTLPIGVLGPEFGLSLKDTASACVVGTALGAMCTAFCSTLGPVTGLRAIATSRYSFGFWGAKLCSILNVVVGGGFAVVNFVTCGQILSAVSNYSMTISVGIIIIALISYFVSVFGFAIIHRFEKYSWILSFILLCILLGQASPHIGASAPGPDTGLSFAGGWLNYMALCFSSSSGWCSIAADYYCNYPANTKKWKIFALTFWGVTIPTVFTTMVGACIGNGAILAEYPPWQEAYEKHGLGGLLREVYHPMGWSKTALVFLTFSVLGNNIMVIYSSGLSLQLLGHWFHAIPRFIWSFATTFVIAVIALVGKDHLAAIVADFVSLLGYWTVCFTFVLLIEDQWFRKGRPELGYNLTVWDTPSKLPIGIAAILALLAGYLGGGVTGMSQVWFVGPIAAKFGPYGGDVGVYMSGAISIVVYFPARYLEIKYTGR